MNQLDDFRYYRLLASTLYGQEYVDTWLLHLDEIVGHLITLIWEGDTPFDIRTLSARFWSVSVGISSHWVKRIFVSSNQVKSIYRHLNSVQSTQNTGELRTYGVGGVNNNLSGSFVPNLSWMGQRGTSKMSSAVFYNPLRHLVVSSSTTPKPRNYGVCQHTLDNAWLLCKIWWGVGKRGLCSLAVTGSTVALSWLQIR